MRYLKRIICLADSRKPIYLANSRKMPGRCVAGLELERGHVSGWIRPVSSPPSGAIPDDQNLADGSKPDLLDILEIPMLEPCPDGCQTENHLIDDEHYWVRIGGFPKQHLLQYCTAPNPLWVNGFHSTGGMNDRIPEWQARSLPNSLVLIEPRQLTIEVRQASGRRKQQVRADFRVAGETYNLAVTDPVIERQYLSLGEGQYNYRPRAVACVSIGEPFQGYYCYKLVASIIPL